MDNDNWEGCERCFSSIRCHFDLVVIKEHRSTLDSGYVGIYIYIHDIDTNSLEIYSRERLEKVVGDQFGMLWSIYIEVSEVVRIN